MKRQHDRRIMVSAAAAALTLIGSAARADMVVNNFGGLPDGYWPGPTAVANGGVDSFVDSDPIYTSIAAPFSSSPPPPISYVNETLSAGNKTVIGETFTTGTTSFNLSAVTFRLSTGGGFNPGDLSLHLFALNGATPTSGFYQISSPNAGPDLLGNGNGLTFTSNGSPDSLLEFDMNGNDQVRLNANSLYSFEVWNKNTGSATLFVTRTGGTWTDSGRGQGYFTNATTGPNEGSTDGRTQLNGAGRSYIMGIYGGTLTAPSPFLSIDINGGGTADFKPTHPGWTGWGGGGTNGILPSSNDFQNDGPSGGYPTDNASRSFTTASTNSGTVGIVMRSVDLTYSSSGNSYTADGPALNSHDLNNPSPGTGGETSPLGYMYRDFATAEIGTQTQNNGTNHRMEIKLDGLKANTPYRISFYTYNSGAQNSVNVFTDVTGNPLVFIPGANVASGQMFMPGDGTNGTQYAPAGQTIDGSAATGAPTTAGAREVSITATTDANGVLLFDETTVTGIANGDINPLLNGIQIAEDSRVFNGQGANSNWTNADNWGNGFVPNGLGNSANFGTTTATSITVDQPITVGRLNFSGTGLTIGGSATITLNDSSINSTLSFTTQGSGSGRTQINVVSGSANQTINAPVVMAKDTQVFVSTASQTLTLSNLQPSTVILSKNGPGTLAVNNVRTNALGINSGAVTILPNGTAAGTSVVQGLTIAGATDAWTAKLDLTNNRLIDDYSTTSPLATVKNQIKQGFAGGAWNGNGITSSSAATIAGNSSNVHKTAIGYAEASQINNFTTNPNFTFGGQAVDSTAVLARYTYTGDANLDGTVTIGDFNTLAANFGTTGKDWDQGDFNFDGKVNLLDVNAVATNFGQPALAPVALGALVPEPTMLSVMAMGLLIAKRRRSSQRD